MRTLYATTAAAAAIALVTPTASTAQDITVYAGIDATSAYVAQGLIFNDNITIQPYIEASIGGVYFGVYHSPVDQNLTNADNESGIYAGYRGEAGPVFYDAAVFYYYYDEPFAEFIPDFGTAEELLPVEYEEYVLSASIGATESLFLTGRFAAAPEFEQYDFSVIADYYSDAGPTLSATYGAVDADFGDWSYWSVGTSIPLGGATSFDIFYHDTDAGADIGTATDGTIVTTLSIDLSVL